MKDLAKYIKRYGHPAVEDELLTKYSTVAASYDLCSVAMNVNVIGGIDSTWMVVQQERQQGARGKLSAPIMVQTRTSMHGGGAMVWDAATGKMKSYLSGEVFFPFYFGNDSKGCSIRDFNVFFHSFDKHRRVMPPVVRGRCMLCARTYV